MLDAELGASYVLLAGARSASFNQAGSGAKRHVLRCASALPCADTGTVSCADTVPCVTAAPYDMLGTMKI